MSKSELVEQVAARLGLKILDIKMVEEDFSDFKGLPIPDPEVDETFLIPVSPVQEALQRQLYNLAMDAHVENVLFVSDFDTRQGETPLSTHAGHADINANAPCRLPEFYEWFGHPGIGKSYTFTEIPDTFTDTLVMPSERRKPEWQRRRDRSREAKAALVARLRKKG